MGAQTEAERRKEEYERNKEKAEREKEEYERNKEKAEKKRKPKTVKCPKCGKIGETVVKEECMWYFLIVLFIPLLNVAFIFYELQEVKNTPGKTCMMKFVHRCPFCNHNCTDVKEYNKSQCCIII